MDMNKFQEFFNPMSSLVKDIPIHIIGCGAVGSTIAENMARIGIINIHLYDFDIVSSHNIANQMFLNEHIDKLKVDCLEEIITSINPDIQVVKHEDGWKENAAALSGYVFLAVDSIELRKKIAEENKYNNNIIAVFDTRIGLTDGQTYIVNWNSFKAKDNFFKSMNFTDEEANKEQIVSACNMQLSIAPTVRIICGYCVANFINYILHGYRIKHSTILADAFNYTVNVF